MSVTENSNPLSNSVKTSGSTTLKGKFISFLPATTANVFLSSPFFYIRRSEKVKELFNRIPSLEYWCGQLRSRRGC